MKPKLVLKTITLLVALLLLSTIVFAADGTDIEPNNSPAQANEITFRGTNGENMVTGCVGKIAYDGDEDWYWINLPAGSYSATLTNNKMSSVGTIFGNLPADYDIYIYHYTDTTSYVARAFGGGTTKEHLTFTVPADKHNTKYYIRIDGYLSAHNDTEQYKFMLCKGDMEMLMEAYRYLYFPHPFYGRQSSGTEYHTKSVAYSYGTKDSLTYYEQKLDEADLNITTTPQTNWDHYSSNYAKPGRYDGEPQSQSAWCGVDCSGFVYWNAKASSQSYTLKSLANIYCGTDEIVSRSTGTTVANLKIGDVSVKSGVGAHAMMISRLAIQYDRIRVIHADGKLNGGRKIFEELLSSARSSFDENNLRSLN